MKNYKKIIFLILLVAVFIIPLKSQAITLPELLPECATCDHSDPKCDGCGFEDFVQLLINAYSYGLALLAVVVLFFFIWGGFGLIIAGGRTEHIQNSKKMITGAFIGMLVVLTSWAMVNFYIFAFVGDTKIEGQFWWGGSEGCHKNYNLPCEKNALKLGCGGEVGSPTDQWIRQVQTELNKVGCDCGTVDGCFGKQTHDCVASYQINTGLADPLGTVGENTWAAIASGIGNCSATFEVEPYFSESSEYCCVPDPNVENNVLSRCLDAVSEQQCRDYNQQGLLNYTLEGACVNHAKCGIGCCVPSSLTDSCYYTENNCLSGELFYPTLCDNSTTTSSVCKWHVCVDSINNCYVQRTMCNGDDATNLVYQSEEEALSKMNSLDDCNYGTCAFFMYEKEDEFSITTNWYACSWVPKSQCNTSLNGVNFYPETSIPVYPNHLPGNIHNVCI